MCSSSPWDFAKFLRLQCRFSSIPYPRWAKKWINIRKEFSSFYSVQRCGIEKMLQNLGLRFDGRHHSGLDDSINIARITLELMKVIRFLVLSRLLQTDLLILGWLCSTTKRWCSCIGSEISRFK